MTPPQWRGGSCNVSESVAFSTSFRCEVRFSRQRPEPKEAAPSGRRDGNPARNLVAPFCCRRPIGTLPPPSLLLVLLPSNTKSARSPSDTSPMAALTGKVKKKARDQTPFHCQGHLPLPAAEKRTMEDPSGDMRKTLSVLRMGGRRLLAEQQSDSRTVNLAAPPGMNRRRGPRTAKPIPGAGRRRRAIASRYEHVSLVFVSPAHCELPFVTTRIAILKEIEADDRNGSPVR